ncbi:MAG: hydroxylamine reductase [Spirochaetes bacterium GWD1_27_9]|nr:MAG: hydroxylamine reductase [Spirochaetes bacterium GWB1_27_13]OHD22015.1 MAG: hydroxylamine reductase [Spirochaetes bacterium GWC1_27_15]OHD28648.1 MAG: hydroxylamine reductase [Spirochaetes bacterium GWD1_27_9]
MFCYQCQETAKNQGCTVAGVCGKSGTVADLLDVLTDVTKGISFWSIKASQLGIEDEETDNFVIEAMFTGVTNVNFDSQKIYGLIKKGLEVKTNIKNKFLAAYETKNNKKFSDAVPSSASWESNASIKDFEKRGAEVGVLSTKNEDIRSLRELLIYGIKGISAYYDHAKILNYKNQSVINFVKKGLASTIDDSLSIDNYIALVMEAGKNAVDTMALLDKANTDSYGIPTITEVFTGTVAGAGILVSGHDLKDFEEILKQTDGTGVNVYTHGEMLPANAYPAFKKYKHLIGNYGTSWYNQQKEFEDFNGVIIMTTNCIQKPKDSYKDKIFTTGLAAWDGVAHIADRKQGGQKDFTAAIKKAKELGSVKVIEGKKIPIGFNHNTILSLADKIVDAVKTGAIKRFFVMGGCDGRQKEREYFTDVAKQLPKDTVILTAGCAKFRYNLLDLGDIGGIPRVIDAGQCNDSYSLAVVALKLVEVFGAKSINDLPISFDIGWYEQKAVTVLLALLFLGVKGIRLGPTLPAFLSPNVAKVLIEAFDLKQTGTAEEDIKLMMAGK